jgi:hypothetical protein
MAGRTARASRVAAAARWAMASPSLTRLVAANTCVVLVAGVVAVAAKPHHGSSAPTPVLAVAEAAETASAPSHAASHATSRSHARTRTRPRARPAPRPAPKGWAYWAPRIRQCESSGDYRAHSPTSSASGAYQILDSTWQGRFGVRHAGDASAQQQDEAASSLYKTYGTSIWAASRPCWRK